MGKPKVKNSFHNDALIDFKSNLNTSWGVIYMVCENLGAQLLPWKIIEDFVQIL